MQKSNLARMIIITIGLLLIWHSIVVIFKIPQYILPSPKSVFIAFWQNKTLISNEAIPTIIETILGFILGSFFGIINALLMAYFKPMRAWLLPFMLLSQAIPTFAIAPILVVWFGYGMCSKIIAAMIMLFFPVTSNFYDGLNQTKKDWLDLANTMNGKKLKILFLIKIPAALPSLASGLRIASTIAPIGAIVGEWVGASHGLGYLMLNANARMQIDLMFAVLLSIVIFTIMLYFTVDLTLKKLITWEN